MRSAFQGAFVLALLALACSRKTEVLPEGAARVTRVDSIVQADGLAYELRSYSFQLKEAEGETTFICEAKKFAEEAEAQAAAVKSIAQRPEEQQKKSSAWYARSGLSQWLLAGKTLTWCMRTQKTGTAADAAMAKLRTAFLRKFAEK